MCSLLPTIRLLLLLMAHLSPGDADGDGDGLSDFHEVHRYFTDPGMPDTDGDGILDGDWNERREFTYSVRAVMHVMAPFDVPSMNDDYQDVRVLDLQPGLIEFEVIVHPFNTVSDVIEPNSRWSHQPSEMKQYLTPEACCNWDERMQAQLLDELEQDSIDIDSLDDVEAVRAVSTWLMERARFEDAFTTFAVEFEQGVPRVSERQQSLVNETLKRFGRTLEEQFDRELYGRGMFETRTRGSCTSSAIYISTGLKAVGLPARTIVCIPVVDANDSREVGWIDSRITHVGVRATLAKAAERQRGSWTSHTFNEVFVGGRWRRLNYDQLGQNVLDPGTLGLMVHVHTFEDHSEAGLIGWGNREVHPLHASLFGGPNPYSCISLSDLFGPHAEITNQLLSGLREATIGRIYWYDDPQRGPKLTTGLGPQDGAGYFFAHIEDTDSSFGGSDYMEFWRAADKHFVLRSRGHHDVPAHGIQKYWYDSGINDFILRIEPADFARMALGVEYELAFDGQDEPLRWNIANEVAITRRRD